MSIAAAADKKTINAEITYEDLYRRWEQNNWEAYALDFSQDRLGWESLSEIQRKSGQWIYSMFFYGEDAVTDGLSPYIDAAPTEEQAYFLATQQVDEARHAVFFGRFFDEVIGAGGTISDRLEYTREHLGWGYRGIFGRLERMFDELRTDKSLPKFAQAIALYHMVIEATLAQPGQHFIEDFFIKSGTMPAFSEGMVNVARDEQRHIGFGVKTLADAFASPQGEECKAAVVEILREMMPYAVGVFVPPGWDERYVTEYGFTLEDIYAWGMRSVEAKWRMTGYPIDEMPNDVFPFDFSTSAEERAARQIKMLKAGLVGEPNGIPEVNPEVQGYLFDVIARSADPTKVDRPVTYQWRFEDADPWYIRIDNGSTRAERGEAEKPDVTLRTTWADWIAASTRGGDTRKAILRRKIKPRGSIRELRRMQDVFPARPPSVSVELNGAR
ncbi:MAG: ribonucleotide-diphosphate reductase subunit beta [Solirubrobacterales bacterium]